MKVCDVALVCWVMTVQGASGDFSRNIVRFLSVLNGDYDNLAQYLTNTEQHDYIQFRAIPVTTPALPGSAAMIIEWAFNQAILSLQLTEVYEGKTGAIFMTPHNFTDISNYTYGTFNLDVLTSLKAEDLRGMKICESEFEYAGDALFVGTWPSCTHFINGKPALYADTLTCNDLRVVIPRSADELSSKDPYDMKRLGKRYKVPGAPIGYVSPCV